LRKKRGARAIRRKKGDTCCLTWSGICFMITKFSGIRLRLVWRGAEEVTVISSLDDYGFLIVVEKQTAPGAVFLSQQDH